MIQPIKRDVTKTRKLYKKCIKCRQWKPRKDILDVGTGAVLEKHGFGLHESSSDGLQSICFKCKNVMNTKARERNVTARVRHHTSTRCLTQLGKLAPPNFTQDMEQHLGYKISALVRALSEDLKEREGSHRKLRDALNEGYHIDHKRPLSSFNVIVALSPDNDIVDWDEFRLCWAITNLSAIPADENLQKGAQYSEDEEVSPPVHLPESPPVPELDPEDVGSD